MLGTAPSLRSFVFHMEFVNSGGFRGDAEDDAATWGRQRCWWSFLRKVSEIWGKREIRQLAKLQPHPPWVSRGLLLEFCSKTRKRTPALIKILDPPLFVKGNFKPRFILFYFDVLDVLLGKLRLLHWFIFCRSTGVRWRSCFICSQSACVLCWIFAIPMTHSITFYLTPRNHNVANLLVQSNIFHDSRVVLRSSLGLIMLIVASSGAHHY